MKLTPPLHDLSVHHSFPFFPVFPVLKRGEANSPNNAPGLRYDLVSGVLPGSSVARAVLSHHGPDRLVADFELGGQ
jgi:hypothetical protein